MPILLPITKGARMYHNKGVLVQKKLVALLLVIVSLSGCFSISTRKDYDGPATRPPELEAYYSTGNSYQSFSEEIISEHKEFTVKKI